MFIYTFFFGLLVFSYANGMTYQAEAIITVQPVRISCSLLLFSPFLLILFSLSLLIPSLSFSFSPPSTLSLVHLAYSVIFINLERLNASLIRNIFRITFSLIRNIFIITSLLNRNIFSITSVIRNFFSITS